MAHSGIMNLLETLPAVVVDDEHAITLDALQDLIPDDRPKRRRRHRTALTSSTSSSTSASSSVRAPTSDASSSSSSSSSLSSCREGASSSTVTSTSSTLLAFSAQASSSKSSSVLASLTRESSTSTSTPSSSSTAKKWCPRQLYMSVARAYRHRWPHRRNRAQTATKPDAPSKTNEGHDEGEKDRVEARLQLSAAFLSDRIAAAHVSTVADSVCKGIASILPTSAKCLEKPVSELGVAALFRKS